MYKDNVYLNDSSYRYNSNDAPRHRLISIVILVLSISVVYIMPDVLISGNNPAHHSIPIGLYVKQSVYLIIFLINYFVIIDRTIIRGRQWGRFSLANTIVYLLAIGVLSWNWTVLTPDTIHQHIGRPHMRESSDIWEIVSRDTAMIVLTIALSVAIKLAQNLLRIERQRAEIRAMRQDMELYQLKAQLNPHFLFNTLNSIYVLVDLDSSKAQEALHKLSKMLRYVLYDDSKTVTLDDELEFIRSYMDLMRLRMPASIPVNAKLHAGDCASAPIEPLIFINVVENAFKYGCGASAGQKGISLNITAEAGIVTCDVSNYYTAIGKQSQSTHSTGIGLDNLRRRLALIYPGRHSIIITDTGNLYRVIISLQLI